MMRRSLDPESSRIDSASTGWVELVVRFGVLAFLLYWAFVLVTPFITIAIWSLVVTVTLSPAYERIAAWLGGRRKLAAVLLTLLSLLVVIGPATWLILGLVESLQILSERLPELKVPPPPGTIKSWPLFGDSVHEFWQLASTNLHEAFARIAPQLKSMAAALLHVGTEAGVGALKLFVAIIVAGFLYPYGPTLLAAANMVVRRVAPERGEEFIRLAGATIRGVAKGVIGISAVQALLAGVGLYVAGVPGANLITSAVLILGIIQIGPSLVLLPVVIWSWFTMETASALLFTAYMIPVSLLDNILRPFVMGRGLQTPVLVTLIGVIGGTLSSGITGLFLGPIILAIVWELSVAWVKNEKSAV